MRFLLRGPIIERERSASRAVRPMAGTPSGQRSWTLVLLLGIVVLGAALRLLRIDAQPLWANEGFSWEWAHLSPAALWGPAARFELTPPLFYAMQHFWMAAFGDSEAALRSLSALFGILTVPLVFVIGRVAGGSRIGLIAALLAATSGPLVAYSQEARTYAFLCFLGALAMLGLVLFFRAWTDPRSWPAEEGSGPPAAGVLGLAAYTLATTLALHAHNTAIFLPLLANLVAAYWWLAHAGRSWKFAAAWIAANLVPFLLWLWWVPVLRAQMADREIVGGYTQPDLPRALFEMTRLYAQRYLDWPHQLPPWLLQLVVPIPLLALLGIWAWRQRGPVLVLLLAFAAGLPFLAYATGLVGRAVWSERVVLWSVPFGMVLIAAGLDAIQAPLRRSLALGVVLAAQAANLAGYYVVQRKEPYDRVARDITASFAPGDAVVVFPYDIHDPFAYYARRSGLPEADYMLFAPDLAVAHATYARGLLPGYPRIETVERGVAAINSLDELRVVAAKHRRLWLVAQKLELNDPRGTIAPSLETLGRVVDHRAYAAFLELFLVETSSR
jgi:mannosyltransferase